MATSIVSPNAVGATVATTYASQSGWATKEDWIRHQALIEYLYRKQTLAKTMDFMTSKYGFKATENMYKKRINQWGLDKKNKANEMRAIARKHRQLGDQGKLTTFRVRGRVIDYKDVIRYWERKGVRIDDVIAQRAESKPPEAVDCFISPPSPTMTPEPITISERILVSIRDYYKRSFEVGTWVATDPRTVCQTTKVQEDPLHHLQALLDQSVIACVLFDGNHFQEAGQTLTSATSRIKRILLAEHPMTLTYLFEIGAYLFTRRRSEMALAILRQFSALAKILVGERHPLHCICAWLVSMHPSQIKDVIVRCSESLGDHFENLVGPMNWSTLIIRLQNLHLLSSEQDMSQESIRLQDLLRECESSLGSLDIRTEMVCRTLAWHYLATLDYVEALKLGWDMTSRVQRFKTLPFRSSVYADGLYVVANSQYAMGETYSAEVHLREAIDIRLSEFGPHDDQARDLLIHLENWLVQQGQLSSAAQVQKRWKDALPDSIDDG